MVEVKSKEVKPTPIWPIWVCGMIILLFSTLVSVANNKNNNYISTAVFAGCLIVTSIIHRENKKYFGKDYRKNPKPTKEAIEKFGKNKYGLNSTQKWIINILTIGGLIVGFLFGGILGAILIGFGLGAVSLSICSFINKKEILKAIGILIFGIALVAIGVWISYFFLISAVYK